MSPNGLITNHELFTMRSFLIMRLIVPQVQCTHAARHTTHTRARARAHTHTPPRSGRHVRACRGRRWTLFFFLPDFAWARLGAPNVQQRVWSRATEGCAVARLLAPESKPVAGLQRARAREFARPISWQIVRAPAPEGARRRRGATEGAAGFRRGQCRGDSKRLGARGSAWPCVSGCAAAVRAWFHVERCARVPRHFGVV